MIPPISFAVAHGHETGRRLRAALHRTHAQLNLAGITRRQRIIRAQLLTTISGIPGLVSSTVHRIADGLNNRQNNFRFSAGVVFRFG